MNERDMTRLAERCRDLARHIEERGTTALRVAAQWTNPRHPDMVGAGDPDSEPQDRDKRDRLDPMRHARLVAGFGRIDAAVATLAWLILDTVPRAPDKPSDDDVGEGWCSSCWRIRWLSPEHQHPDGRPKHKALCSWCASFKKAQGQLPPESLLRKRRDGRRISDADVARALGKARAS